MTGRPSLPTRDELAALPSDGGPSWNRLVFEKSPYLIQHAGNPVDWWPWGEAAFAAARARDVPVFLSVGYATCHWCHVMEHESFEDDEVAALLNAHFVPVKVDREERPDVDHVYMMVTQALTGSGGWPMTVALTPDRRPFFAGTYFPKHGRLGRPGMLDLLPHLAAAWRERRQETLEMAARVTGVLAELASGEPGDLPGTATLDAARESLASRFDPRHGGFGGAPKFPTPHVLSFLLREHARTGDALSLGMVETTLAGMRRGGLWDHVGFGFHRYSTDREWHVPHFEKMLYDQALLAVAYLEAFQVTGRPEHADTARKTLEYVRRDLGSPDGAFWSAEDADSEGEEGLFYVWTPAEVAAAVGSAEAALACRALDVTEAGNYHEEGTGRRTGRSVLRVALSAAELADELGLSAEAVTSRLEAARLALFAARARRPRPLRDDKVLTDWNGLAIAAMARGARALAAPELEAAARRAAEDVLVKLRRPDGRLLKRYRDGEASLPGVAEDHAYLAWGLFELHQATQDARWLSECLRTLEVLLDRFWDGDRGGLFLTADDGEELPTRAKESHDGALPSANSVAALTLLRLGRLLGRPDLELRADAILRAFAQPLQRAPAAHAHALMAASLALGPSFEVVVAGAPEEADTLALLQALDRAFLPNVVVLLRPPGDDAAILELAPRARDQVPIDGRAAAYVCRDQACDAPVTSADALLEKLRSG